MHRVTVKKMALLNRYKSDVAALIGRDCVEAILKRRYDNGGDLWTTPDKRLGKGSPFSTLDCGLMLKELGDEPHFSQWAIEKDC